MITNVNYPCYYFQQRHRGTKVGGGTRTTFNAVSVKFAVVPLSQSIYVVLRVVTLQREIKKVGNRDVTVVSFLTHSGRETSRSRRGLPVYPSSPETNSDLIWLAQPINDKDVFKVQQTGHNSMWAIAGRFLSGDKRVPLRLEGATGLDPNVRMKKNTEWWFDTDMMHKQGKLYINHVYD